MGSTWIIGSSPSLCSCHGDNVHMYCYSELISKHKAICKENETLHRQQKKYNALLKNYQSKLASAVTSEEVRNVYCVCHINMQSRINVLLLD